MAERDICARRMLPEDMPRCHATTPNDPRSSDLHTWTQRRPEAPADDPRGLDIARDRTPDPAAGSVLASCAMERSRNPPRFSGEFESKGAARASLAVAVSRRGAVADVTVVARLNGEVVGTASGQEGEVAELTRWMRARGRSGWADPIWSTFRHGERVGNFQGLWVDRDRRNVGVGASLAEELVRRLEAEGAAAVVATAAPSDLETEQAGLTKLFVSLGFSRAPSMRPLGDWPTMVRRARRDNPGGVERVGPSSLPWSPSDVLCFHRLSHAGDGAAGHARLVADARRGMALRPASSRPGQDRGIGSLDVSAGDGRFVFFSPCAPVGGEPSLEPEGEARDWHHRPAVAYAASKLFAMGRVGWRPHDLIHAYEAAAMGGRRSSLGSVSRAGTAWARRDVVEMLRLYAAHLRAAGDGEAREAVAARARLAVVRLGARAKGERDIDWSEPFKTPEELGLDVEDAWPDVLGCGPTPEIIVAAEVPLSVADYHYDSGARVWVSGPPGGA